MAPYRLNADGIVRTRDQALALAKSYGIDIPSDIFIVFINNWQRKDAQAEYFWRRHDRNPNSRYEWSDFYNDKTGKIPIRFNAAILSSDESIVAHELHELSSLRTLFEDNEYLSARQLVRLIHPLHEGGFKGNLHDQAWDVADRLIAKMRNE